MILVFGGAFNPPTVAHFQIMTDLLEKYHPTKLIIIPTGDGYNKAHLAPYFHRVKMLEILASKLDAVVEISQIEKDAPFLGTYHSLSVIQKQHPNEEISFVLGTDHLATISTWISAEKLLKEFSFIIVRRQNFTPDYRTLSVNNTKYEVVEFDSDIASTKFRVNKEKYKDDVLAEVYQYITTHHLY